MPPELGDDHVAAVCQALIDHEVEFVIIGGMSARLHETGHTTIDVDICPSIDDANLSSLTDALRELGARLRVEGDPAGVAFDPHPAGFLNGYDSLPEHASVIVVGAVEAPVASLRDVVTYKRAAGRPKDVVAVPPLEAHLASRER